ncbi:prepilin-type N-terminal cleavage/methylation domain-containing protein [Homoserinimonas aerilata]|uniref:Prepilin-type N-terminal cleavage/methylation domain-containing protein n=1 Tax=Homoserinimonas aerilata TaxID=1162970 RepID=A0A542Y1F9_9MICO|nr:prepilin-type N-terminal cleavage/methylation domain-containing protein [Homoserinimonas aerilata]
MDSIRTALRRTSDERGMTLIEVVVAVVILGLLSTLSLSLYMTSMNASSTHKNRELAITVANESMEIVSGWSPTAKIATTSLSTLFAGRTAAAVAAQWAAAPANSGLEQTYPTWDTTGASAPELPLSSISTFNGTKFLAQTFIGTCFQPVSGGDCKKLAGQATAPSVAPGGYSSMVRATVVVTWTAGDCDSGHCWYKASTLLDLNSDLDWVTHD